MIGEPVPFDVHVPEAEVADVRGRLARTRYSEPGPVDAWSTGVPTGYLRELVDFWLHEFDWRAVEARLGALSHWRLDTGRARVHFVHVPARTAEAVPIVLVHGWPSSFLELLELADLLADPAAHGGRDEDGFDVVVPSLPGFGFSDTAWEGPWTPTTAGAIHQVMTSLGYERYGVHTHDVGASAMTAACLSHPGAIIGYHTTEPGIPGPYPPPEDGDLSESERAYHAIQEAWRAEHGGYFDILRSRARTLAHALNDSPAGLAAWVAEKWWTWTVPPGSGLGLDDLIPPETVVATIALYWFTGTVGSANRIFTPGQSRIRSAGERARVPVGVTLDAQEIERAPRERAERFFSDIRYWEDLGRGGHFLAAEEPELLADSIRSFFRPLRSGR